MAIDEIHGSQRVRAQGDEQKPPRPGDSRSEVQPRQSAAQENRARRTPGKRRPVVRLASAQSAARPTRVAE